MNGTSESTGPKRSEEEIIRDIRNTYSRLSPENLAADGERPVAQRRRLAAELNTKLRTLFTEIGRNVSESEAYADPR